MLSPAIDTDSVRFGERFTLRFERTIRVPDDGRTYPLPPGLGRFAVHRVDEYRDRVPAPWRDRGGIFIAMHQAEALWLSFDAAPWKPSAVTVGVGRINALSGGTWPGTLDAAPQNYLVCPPQLWLDGINAGHGFVRQFVAMPLGQGATVEGQITGVETHGGLQVRVFDPRPGRFPDVPPPEWRHPRRPPPSMASASGGRMGFVPGGQIDQKVLADPHGVDTWDPERFGTLVVHVLNSAQYAAVTGRPAPPSPVSARTYAEHGFPWFRRFEEAADVPPADALAQLISLSELLEHEGHDTFDVDPSTVVDLTENPSPPRSSERS
jgi:hypothetical protein